jgi:crossover junction endodeoxyribonuclease RuvC
VTRILGIDPGLANTGWAMIGSLESKISFIASGTITTTTKNNTSERLLIIYEKLSAIISQFDPTEAAIEDSFVNNNPLSSLKLGQARAAGILAVGSAKIKIAEYAPRLIKKAIVGSGRAEKEQIAGMIKYLLPTANVKNDHEADALAIAITHSNIAATAKRMSISQWLP